MKLTLEDIKDEALVRELEGRGYRVRKGDDAGWMTFGELAQRVKRSSGSLCKVFKAAGGNPPGVEILRGEKGRILNVRPGESFFVWLAARCNADLPGAGPRSGEVKTSFNPDSLVKDTARDPASLRGVGGNSISAVGVTTDGH